MPPTRLLLPLSSLSLKLLQSVGLVNPTLTDFGVPLFMDMIVLLGVDASIKPDFEKSVSISLYLVSLFAWLSKGPLYYLSIYLSRSTAYLTS